MNSILGIAMPPEFDAYTRFRAQAVAAMCANNYLLQAQLLVMKDPDSGLAECSKEVEEFAGALYGNTTGFFMSQIFIATISAFEVYLQDTLKMVVKRHPKKVGSVTFKLNEIIDATTTDILVDRAVDEVLYKLMYKKPLEYLREYCELLSLDSKMFETDWAGFVEAKARRDLGVHAAWRVNQTYLRKLEEGGIATQLSSGEIALPSGRDYFHGVLALLNRLADLFLLEVERKYFPATEA